MLRLPVITLFLSAFQVFARVVPRDAENLALNVSIPFVTPDSARELVSTLVSFSLEQDRWPDWVGVDERNEFTANALDNLAKLTGQPPKIRVGANSEDHTTWSPTVTVRIPPHQVIVIYCASKLSSKARPRSCSFTAICLTRTNCFSHVLARRCLRLF